VLVVLLINIVPARAQQPVVQRYDVYALDLRGMGLSDQPANYFNIDILNRVSDALAVARHIVQNTGRIPVVRGFYKGPLEMSSGKGANILAA